MGDKYGFNADGTNIYVLNKGDGFGAFLNLEGVDQPAWFTIYSPRDQKLADIVGQLVGRFGGNDLQKIRDYVVSMLPGHGYSLFGGHHHDYAENPSGIFISPVRDPTAAVRELTKESTNS